MIVGMLVFLGMCLPSNVLLEWLVYENLKNVLFTGGLSLFEVGRQMLCTCFYVL